MKKLLTLGGILVTMAIQAGPAYPLKLSNGQHYLVDQNNVPFFIQGDSPWYLVECLRAPDVDYYLSNRWVQGFNSIILDLAAQKRDTGQSFEGNLYGQLPFTNMIAGPYTNLLSWNTAYFTNVDAVIRRAGYYGINVFAYPLYDGYSGLTWYAQMVGNGSNAIYSYGNFIGNRYKNFTNLVWLGAGDYSEPNAPGSCLWNIMAAGIRSADTNHLFAAQAARPTPASYYSGFVTVNCSYGSLYPYVESLANYQRTPVLASFAREPYYENRNLNGTLLSALDCRHFAYWAVFSGDMGHFYGDENQWPYGSGWQTEMWDAGVTTITNVARLMTTRPWWNCVPDAAHTTMTNGYGTYGTADYAVCTREATGKTVMVYIPQNSLKPTLDLSRISGTNANAWWYNPRTGAATLIGNYATTGARTFTPPDASDWVLVLDDAAQNYGVPGVRTLQLSIQFTGTNSFRLSFPGQAGWQYSIQSATNLAAKSWQVVGTVSGDTSGVVTYTGNVTAGTGFYRSSYP